MRARDKIILWPVYFDSSKTRSQGRRVPKKIAVPTPKLNDIQTAVEKLGLKCTIATELAYPRSPWGKTGHVSVSKGRSKNNLLNDIAESLRKIDHYQ